MSDDSAAQPKATSRTGVEWWSPAKGHVTITVAEYEHLKAQRSAEARQTIETVQNVLSDAKERAVIRLARFEAFTECVDLVRSFVTPLCDGSGYPAHEAAAETADEIANRIEELRSAAKPRDDRRRNEALPEWACWNCIEPKASHVRCRTSDGEEWTCPPNARRRPEAPTYEPDSIDDPTDILRAIHGFLEAGRFGAAFEVLRNALDRARADDRELCARVAEDYAPGCMGGVPIAAAIRRLRSGDPHDPLKRWERLRRERAPKYDVDGHPGEPCPECNPAPVPMATLTAVPGSVPNAGQTITERAWSLARQVAIRDGRALSAFNANDIEQALVEIRRETIEACAKVCENIRDLWLQNAKKAPCVGDKDVAAGADECRRALLRTGQEPPR